MTRRLALLLAAAVAYVVAYQIRTIGGFRLDGRDWKDGR